MSRTRRPPGTAIGRPGSGPALFGRLPNGTFGCSIDPTPRALAAPRICGGIELHATQTGSTAGLAQKSCENKWDAIDLVEGIDPRTVCARVLIEADYRMKLVGMGLGSRRRRRAELPGAWLTSPRYGASAARRTAPVVHAQIRRGAGDAGPQHVRDPGPGVRVLSENEMLTQLGPAVHSGKSEPANQEFAQRFTRHFAVPWPKNIRCMPTCKTCLIWPWFPR